MGVAITIFTYFGDEEETLPARFYGVEKAFYKAFEGDINIIKEYFPGDIMKEYSHGGEAYIVGTKKPEAILQEAETWNKRLEEDVVQQKMDLKNYQITLKIFSIQNDGHHILGICGHLCEI